MYHIVQHAFACYASRVRKVLFSISISYLVTLFLSVRVKLMGYWSINTCTVHAYEYSVKCVKLNRENDLNILTEPHQSEQTSQ